MSESWGFDLAAVGPAGAVGHQINAKLSLPGAHRRTPVSPLNINPIEKKCVSDLWCFHGRVCGAGGNLVTFCVQFKVVDQGLHRCLGRKGEKRPKGVSENNLILKIKSQLNPFFDAGELTFISDLFGGATLASSILISPSGILLSAWSMILRDCLISSTLQRYLRHTHRRKRSDLQAPNQKKAP